MGEMKKWSQDAHVIKKNGLYVHYSPPKVVGEASSQQLRQWAREGAARRLERAVLGGQGRRLLAAADAVPLPRRLLVLIAKCNALHAAVERGSLMELQELLESDCNQKKHVTCFDEAGVGLLHKAVYYNYLDIAEWLVENYPHLVHLRDSEGRTALHYTAACRQQAAAGALLERAGAARGARDAAGRTLAYYRAARTPLALPVVSADAMPARPNPTGLVIKRHNIRIWCHECDMGRLQRVVWEGHGARLLSEVSSQPVVKKFLEAVPYLMNTIRDMHNAVIQNDLEGLIRLTTDPVPPQAMSSRDVNNMTVMHKAAGLGHGGILKYIIERYPQGILDVDNDGRTPLHYAATVKDEQHTYNTLVDAGADESVVDNKNRTPGYYINRSQEIDKNMFHTLPDAPRTPSSVYPSSWDWKILSTDFIADLNKKSRKKNLKASNENISSKKTTTSTISESIENHSTAMKGSSTHELISNLPELDDTEKTELDNTNNKDIHEGEDNQNTIDQNDEDQKEQKELICENEENTHTVTEENADKETIKDDKQDKDLEESLAKALEIENEPDINLMDNEQNTEIQEETTDSEDKTEQQQHVNNGDENEVDRPETNHGQYGTEQLDDITRHDNQDTEVPESTTGNGTNDINDNENIGERHCEKPETEPELDENKKIEISDDIIKDISFGNTNDAVNLKDAIPEEEKNETIATGDEGNNYSSDHNEDDDDVQVQGDCHSEHSDDQDTNNLPIAENSITTRGNPDQRRNTHENLIEGIISGEAEQDSQDASMSHRGESVKGDLLIVDSEIDPEVTDLINTTNMEMLATLVLNGEGSRLIGRHSENSELQAFLDNVPTYMQKINKVHLAAKEGNLRDLQAALDRRKFAIARDPVSPNGATPLHVATVFGKTNIIKYLGGRFPETLSAVDFEGRTALHYGAVLPDNGHYYNLLQQLGANSKDLDDNGKSAEDYYKNPTLLPFNQLLMDYDISEEAAKNMLSDKVPRDHVSSRRVLDIPEAMDTLNRCYRLLASARPSRAPLSASSNKATPPLVLGRFLKEHVFEIIKHRITKADHDLFDVIWPAVKKLPDNRNLIQTVEEDFPGGVTAPDYYVYEVFAEFMFPLIKDLHNINVNSELPAHPMSDFLKSSTLMSVMSSEPLIELNVDPNDEFVLSGTIECTRNLNGFELPLNLKIGKLEDIERILTTILMQEDFAKIIEQINPESDQRSGSYYTLNEVLEKPSEICAALASSGLLIALCDRDEIDDCTRLHGRHWPYGRGVYVSDDKTFAVWINVHDHLRILISTPTDSPGEIGLNQAANGHMDIPIFHTEEGRYLAKSLGDPLIKGLTEVANVKPKDPIAFLATFLHNFPDQEKPRLGTQESNTLITEEEPEVENEQFPTEARNGIQSMPVRSAARTATKPHRPIDVITVDPQRESSPDKPEDAFSSSNRDEHGQSMLHFAAARPHTNNALFQLLQESEVSLGYRDELYRTARDVSIQANVPDNTTEIDKWVLHLAARGKTDKMMELLLQGYDHILDVVEDDGAPITEVVSQRGDSEMSNLLASIPAFEESRESLHGAVRRGDLAAVKETLATEGSRTFACGQNTFGRTSLHVAVLAEHEDIVAHLAETFPQLLRIGDNLERSPLHYAMGVDKIELLSKILIRAGAKRVLKDLKGRQPTYYFMNKSDILRLKEEESLQ